MKDGEQIELFLGEDRQAYFQKSDQNLCTFQGRMFRDPHKDIMVIYITKIPKEFDGGIIQPPVGYIFQGIDLPNTISKELEKQIIEQLAAQQQIPIEDGILRWSPENGEYSVVANKINFKINMQNGVLVSIIRL